MQATPPKKINEQSGVNTEFLIFEKEPEKNSQTAATGLPEPVETKSDISEDRSFAAEQKMNIANRSAAALGLICQNNPDGSKSYVPNLAGHFRGRLAWVDQGIGLGLWENKAEAIEFQGQIAQYARNQDWCRSPLDYANSAIRGLLAGDNPKADRYWEAWRNNQPIGWENLFTWEITPGVVNPAFANWVTTQLFDSTKSPAANTAEAAKQIRFNARPLWERYQREVAREVQVAAEHQQRGQTYLPAGSLLPRTDQPTAEQTYAAIEQLTQAQGAVVLPVAVESVPQLSAESLVVAESEITMEEFAVRSDKADIMDRMRRIGRQRIARSNPIAQPSSSSVEIQASMTVFVAPDPIETPPPPPVKPRSVELLSAVNQRRKMLETQWRRQKPPYDLAAAAKYLVWAEQGDEDMKIEAKRWLLLNRLAID